MRSHFRNEFEEINKDINTEKLILTETGRPNSAGNIKYRCPSRKTWRSKALRINNLNNFNE